MRLILMCHSRSGSTYLFNSLMDNAKGKIEWGVHNKKDWSSDWYLDRPYNLSRCIIDQYTPEDLEFISKNNCMYLYRESIFDVGLSLCIGDIKGVWQKHMVDESYYKEKITIDRNHLDNKIAQYRKFKNRIINLWIFSGAPRSHIMSYERLYYDRHSAGVFLSKLKQKSGLIFSVDSIVDFLSDHSMKLNTYENISNIDEVNEWRRGYE